MTVTIDGSASVTINSGAVLGLNSATAVPSTSGTSIDFTSIPSYVKRITVMLSGVSGSGTSNFLVQIGSGSIQNTGYVSSASAGTGVTSTAGFIITQSVTAATSQLGFITLVTLGSNIWVENGVLAFSNASVGNTSGGNVTLGGTLDRLRITTVNGTDTFDLGTINILYE